MGLNKSNGNMYDWITHTWNTVKGACPHDCSYCYMKRFGRQSKLHFDEKELKTNLGTGNFIFVGSGCDLFANDIPTKWVIKTLEYCQKFDNEYLFQTKNPKYFKKYIDDMPPKTNLCTTIESDVYYWRIMRNSPPPIDRGKMMFDLTLFPKFVTIEPILEFNLKEMIEIIKMINPIQVNVGADTGKNNLPEPPKEKILALISELEKFTIVKQKKNLKRLIN